MPTTRRPDDDYDDEPRRGDDDRPRRRRRDDDGPPPPKSSGVGKILLILVLVAGGVGVLCCGGCGVALYLSAGKQVTMLDGTRTKSPQGGTSNVTVNVRIGPDSPGGFVRGDYYFMFKSGGRTSVHERSLRSFGPGGGGGGEYRNTFSTRELENEPGPVEFWVERRDRDSVHKVSPTYTIP